MGFRSAISVAAFTAAVVLAAVPEAAWAGAPAVCVFRNLFEFECAGCGMTRALSAAAHGNFGEAVALNAGVVVAAPALAAAVLQGLWRRR